MIKVDVKRGLPLLPESGSEIDKPNLLIQTHRAFMRELQNEMQGLALVSKGEERLSTVCIPMCIKKLLKEFPTVTGSECFITTSKGDES